MPVRIFRGDTWTRAWELRDATDAPINLTGATARLQVRNAVGAAVITASTADGRITITPASGRLDLHVPYSATGIAPGNYRFDLEVTHANGVRRTYEQDTLMVLEDISRD